jgi:predicted NUDIX family NTP pyrophosphohydrolase
VAKTSAGILLFRRLGRRIEVFLVHPGGPFWASKDDGAWSIPKGIYNDREDPLDAAKREFAEEVGLVPEGDFIELGSFRQASGKTICAWAVQGDIDPTQLKSNSFQTEWPPRSGRMHEFPEVDRGGWFSIDAAKQKLLKGQIPIVLALTKALKIDPLRVRKPT